MIVTETKLAGVFVVQPQRFEDERGFIAPSFSAKLFAAHGMCANFVENNISYSKRRGTIRGLHFQAPPHGQAKLVRCTRGSVFDVAVDLRPESKTFKEWVGIELSADNRSLLYLPDDCAHGYQSLEDDSEVFYMVSQVYAAESGRGFRWNDPAFNIPWPSDDLIMLDRDRNYQDFVA